MYSKKKINIKTTSIIVSISIFMGSVASLYSEGGTVEKEGAKLLSRADRIMYPVEGVYDVSITANYEDGRKLNWSFEGYKKGVNKQTIVMTQPPIQRNNVGIRSGDVIYWKPRKWPKPQIMSYQSVFLESPLSYGDILSVNLNNDYLVKELRREDSGDVKLVLAPRKTGAYAKLDIIIEPKTGYTKKRVYYTASGDILKIASYSDYITKGGVVISFKISMEHEFLKIKGHAIVSEITARTTPDYIYNPGNIGRVHARKK